MSLKFVSSGLIYNISSLVQVMALPGLKELVSNNLYTRIECFNRYTPANLTRIPFFSSPIYVTKWKQPCHELVLHEIALAGKCFNSTELHLNVILLGTIRQYYFDVLYTDISFGLYHICIFSLMHGPL